MSYLITILCDIAEFMIIQFQGRPRNFVALKCFETRVNAIYFFIYYCLREIFLQWDSVLGVSFDCGKSVLQHFKSSWLLPAKNDYRLLNTQDCSTNAYLKRFSRKLETNLRWGLFYMGIFWVVGLQTTAYLKWSTMELYKKPKTRTTKTKKEHVRLDGGRCGYQNQWWYLCIRCYQNL